MARILFWLASALFLLLGCAPSAQAPSYTILSADLSPLRARFNADTEKVRAIFLAAPT
jgi:hypothetical protein